MDILYLENLDYQWTANVELKNGILCKIWWTALPSTKNTIDKIISISSDYPKKGIGNLTCL
jgi:hypothetical protein